MEYQEIPPITRPSTAAWRPETDQIAQGIDLNAEGLFILRALAFAGDGAVHHIAHAADHDADESRLDVSGQGGADAPHGEHQVKIGDDDGGIVVSDQRKDRSFF